MEPNSGILLAPGYAPHQTHRMVTTQSVGRYRVTIVEEPPQRRLLHYSAAPDDDDPTPIEAVHDMPLPWTYTYIKQANLAHGGWQLWQTAWWFSQVQLKDPRTQVVYAPYLPNMNHYGEICWGADADLSMPDDLGAGVRRVLQNFWMRNFNDDVTPAELPYALALRETYGLGGHHLHVEQLLERFATLSIDQVLGVPLAPELGFMITDRFWIPELHVATDTKLGLSDEFIGIDENYDEDTDYDDDDDDPGDYD